MSPGTAAGGGAAGENTARQSLAGLVLQTRAAYLGTLEADGTPYVSMAGFVPEWTARAGRLWFLLSGIARHTRNLARDARSSVLLVQDAPSVSLQERTRATLLGSIARLNDGSRTDILKTQYLARYPEARSFLALPDFGFWGFEPKEIHWFGGFGTARTFAAGGAAAGAA